MHFQGTFVPKMMAEHISYFTTKFLLAIDGITDA